MNDQIFLTRFSFLKMMNMWFKRFLLLAFVACIRLSLLTAQPGWTVIPNDFEFTMSVIGVEVINCVESTDEHDMIGAFINGEVRGVQTLNTDINGRKYAYMIIYENDFSGNVITFKMWDASEDSIYDAAQSITFLENSIIGNEDDPFVFNTDYNFINYLTQDSIDEHALAGSVVAEIFSINEIQDTFSLAYDFVNDQLGPDNHFFTINDSLVVLNEDVDADVKASYQIHVVGSTIEGCTTSKVFTLYVRGQGTTATKDPAFNENDILIYPNPASETLHFVTEKRIDRMRIFSIDGALIQSFSKLTGQPIDISFLNPGIYLLACEMDGARVVKRLVVQD